MYSYVSVLFLCTFVYICLLMFVSVYSCYVCLLIVYFCVLLFVYSLLLCIWIVDSISYLRCSTQPLSSSHLPILLIVFRCNGSIMYLE